jgi:hypothetical protein
MTNDDPADYKEGDQDTGYQQEATTTTSATASISAAMFRLPLFVSLSVVSQHRAFSSKIPLFTPIHETPPPLTGYACTRNYEGAAENGSLANKISRERCVLEATQQLPGTTGWGLATPEVPGLGVKGRSDSPRPGLPLPRSEPAETVPEEWISELRQLLHDTPERIGRSTHGS